MKRGGQLGNNNGGKGKPITDALIKALHEECMSKGTMTKRLVVLAHKLLDKAETGDMTALREVLDRVEGKPQQAIEHSGTVEHVEIDAIAVLKQRIEGMASRMETGPDTEQSQDESVH